MASEPAAGARVEVRVYRSTDREAVVALWRRVFPGAAARNDPERNLDRKLARDPELLLVATRDERLVGTTMAGYDGHRGWLYLIAVDPELRRTGVGRALVDRACRELAARGCPKVNLQIVAANASVAGFYQALGFSVEERISMGRELAEAGVDASVPARESDC